MREKGRGEGGRKLEEEAAEGRRGRGDRGRERER